MQQGQGRPSCHATVLRLPTRPMPQPHQCQRWTLQPLRHQQVLPLGNTFPSLGPCSATPHELSLYVHCSIWDGRIRHPPAQRGWVQTSSEGADLPSWPAIQLARPARQAQRMPCAAHAVHSSRHVPPACCLLRAVPSLAWGVALALLGSFSLAGSMLAQCACQPRTSAAAFLKLGTSADQPRLRPLLPTVSNCRSCGERAPFTSSLQRGRYT